MTYPLGALVPLSITVRDSAGQPAATTPVTLTVTLPDGTTATPAVSTSTVGVYFVDYAAPQAGRYEFYWTTGGTVVSAYGPDVFEVAPATRAPLVSLADAKAHLNQTGSVTTNDGELLAMLGAVTDAVESHLGRPVRRKVVTDRFSGACRPSLNLRSVPCPCTTCQPYRVLTVTSVLEDGQTLDPATDYTLSLNAGVLYRGAVTAAWLWSDRSRENVQVTYTTGYTGTPPWARLAVLRAIENTWTRSQQRPHPAYGQGSDSEFEPSGMAYTLPYAVEALLRPHRSPGF